jgi:DNA-directed RNA polymerase specialized sigma24 family protein
MALRSTEAQEGIVSAQLAKQVGNRIEFTIDVLKQFDLATVARQCAVENERYQRGEPSDPSYAFELFRRALAERDEHAWDHLFRQYRGMVERWVRNNAAFDASGEASEDLVVEAFARFWHAVPPAHFERFPTAAALLHYLQMCAGSVVIDIARSRTSARIASEQLLLQSDGLYAAPEEEVLDQIDRVQFWRHVARELNSDVERVVIKCSFIEDLKPRQIYAAHRSLFASIKEVYLTKRNVLDRLRRNPELRDLLD